MDNLHEHGNKSKSAVVIYSFNFHCFSSYLVRNSRTRVENVMSSHTKHHVTVTIAAFEFDMYFKQILNFREPNKYSPLNKQ